MREILFKAKRVDSEGWTEGCLIKSSTEQSWIKTKESFFEVRTETVCQYTGLTDSVGNRIFEGDTIRDHVGHGVIVFHDANASFKVSYSGKNEGRGKWFTDYLDREFQTLVVTGNAHD